jgi:NTE family protein
MSLLKRRPAIGLALGGGGARGIAHIGVLKVLEQERIPIDLIVGTSIGALVGASYALNPDTNALETRLSHVLDPKENGKTGLKRLGKVQWDMGSKSDFLRRIISVAQKEMFLNFALFRNALLSDDDLRECVEAFVADVDIEAMKIPFGAAVVDLISGKQLVIQHGSIVRAVMASCAVPGFMPAISWENMLLIDGGILNSLPFRHVKDGGADLVIAVDVGSCLERHRYIDDGIDTIHRTMEIMSFQISSQGRNGIDILLEPEVRNTDWTDFPDYEELIRRGENAAESKIRTIREMSNYPLRKKMIQWPKKVYAGLGKRGQRIFRNASA